MIIRKWIVMFLVLATVSTLLASCGGGGNGTIETSSETEREETADPVSEEDSHPIVIPVVDPSDTSAGNSEPEESYAHPWEDPNFDPDSYENPHCTASEIVTPSNSDDGHFPIRSLTQTQSGTVLAYGISEDDTEANDAIGKICALLQEYEFNDKISFFAYSLDGTTAISYNCRQGYSSGCTIKTAFILYCCLAIDQGLADRNEVMIYQSKKYYHTGSGTIKDSPDGTPYTLEQLITKALSISDNVAYEMLTDYFGHTGYNRMVEELGVSRLKLGSSLWTRDMNARDLAIIWRELYFYFQAGSPMSKVYYNACTNTQKSLAYAIASLPGIKYSHKSGDMFPPNPVTNDGALIWSDHPYIIVVLNATEHEVNRYTMNSIVQQIHYHIMKQ